MNSDLYTIEIPDPHKAKKLFRRLDNMGILVSSKCKCVAAGRKRCQYGSGQTCKKGYVIIVPKQHREVTISVANAVDSTG